MVDIVGYNRMASKEGRTFCIIYYKTDKKVTYGAEYGSVLSADEYADKLISYYSCGGKLSLGWSPEKKRNFLYIPKEK